MTVYDAVLGETVTAIQSLGRFTFLTEDGRRLPCEAGWWIVVEPIRAIFAPGRFWQRFTRIDEAA